ISRVALNTLVREEQQRDRHREKQPVSCDSSSRKMLIRQLRVENEESTTLAHRFSRACGVCLAEVPRKCQASSSARAATRSAAPARKRRATRRWHGADRSPVSAVARRRIRATVRATRDYQRRVNDVLKCYG
ncbi:hypothetical protein PENTCL1PPCAC_24031, partial [Pristionchus entomophagus]